MSSKSRMLVSPDPGGSRTVHSLRRLLALILATAVGVLAVPGIAHADIVTNTVTAAGENRITAGGSTTIGYVITNTNTNERQLYPDTQTSCNPADGTSAVLTVSAPVGVSVTPASRTISGCGTTAAQSFGFTSSVVGEYPITVSVSDAGGGVYTTAPATFTLYVSAAPVVNTAPSVSVTGVAHSATYEFDTVPAAGCAVTDAQDGNSAFAANLSAITGPRAAQGLGSQTASCSYTDTANGGGLTATASATYTIVDTTRPAVDAVAPASTEATGPLTPVAFSASAFDAVDGSLPTVCVTAGAVAYASGDSFPVGTTTLTCSATDGAGNTASAAPIAVVVTDTTKPLVTTSGNLVVGNDQATVSYDAASATDFVDGDLAATCSPASGSAFALGLTTVTCTAEDIAGNIGSRDFTVTVQDVIKPIVTVPANITREATGPNGAPATYSGVSAEDGVDGVLDAMCDAESGITFPLGVTTITCSAIDAAENTGTNTFTVTVEDTTAPAIIVPARLTVEATSSAGAAVSFSASASDIVDGDLPVTCLPASGSTFALGDTLVTCSATDAAGIPGTGTFTVTVRDTTAPVVTVPDDIVEEASDASGAEVTFDEVSALDSVDGAINPICTPSSGSTFALGVITVVCTATDAARNPGSASFSVTVVDTTKPEVTAPANLVVGNTSGTGADDVVYSGASAFDLVDGSIIPICTPASGSDFPLGFTTVTCTATDEAGNTGSASFTIEVQDKTEPIITVPADIVAEATGPSGATVSYSGVSALDDVDGPVDATCSRASGSMFALGATPVTCSATDRAGNTGSSYFTVTVNDTIAPTLTVSPNRSAEATSASGAIVTYAAPTAIDVVDGTVSASCDVPSGSVFPLGATTVTCRATDAARNTGSASFLVTVVDTTEPDVTAPDNLVVGNTSGTGAANVTYSGATAFDLVDGSIPPTCTPASGSDFPLGLTTVTCSATDKAGNTGRATFTLEVEDQTKPMVIVPDDILAEATGSGGATVSYSGVSALDDVDGPVSASCDVPSASVFPLGTTTVTCRATDAAGNAGEKQFTVTVRDTSAPSLTVSPGRTATATSPSGAIVTYAAPTANDVVDGTLYASCDVPSGSIFPLGTTTVTCRSTDRAGNAAQEQFSVTVTFSWSNVLQPINADNSSAFKQGSTVPVKFTLTGASAGISTAVARLWVQRIGSGGGGELEAISTASATTGNEFRYDATAGQYIFNLGTKKLTPGVYQLRIDLGDNVTRTVIITLR